MARDRGKTYLSKIFDAIKKKLGSSALTEDDFNAIVKTARSSAGGTAKSEKMKAEIAELVAVEHQFAEGANASGLMVCFYLSQDAAAQLAIPDGEELESLHLTLCYLGDTSKYNDLAIAEIIIAARDQARWQTPLSGEVSGTGRFLGDSEDVYYASIDVPGLNEFRTDLARRLGSAGTPVATEHGFDPHVTLAYLVTGEPTPDYDVSGINLRFDTLTVKIGDRRIDLPMLGSSAYSEVADICASENPDEKAVGGPMRLFMEQPDRFAEPPDWINYLPKPGLYTSPRYGEITITRERNQRFVDNFTNKVYQEELPIDCEHDLAQSGATGWITLLKVNDDGSVDAQTRWTDRGSELIKNDRFRYFSPAWYDQWTDPLHPDTKIKDVAIGGALTTRPFFKEKALRPLVANEQGISVFDGDLENLKNSDAVNNFTTLKPALNTDEGAPDMSTPGTGAAVATKFDKNNPPKTMTEALTLLGSLSEELTAKETALTAKETELTAATTQAVALCDKTNPPKTLTEAIKAIGEKADSGLRTASETERKATETVTQLTETVTKQNERIETLEKDKRVSSFAEKAKDWIGDRQGHLEMLEFIATKSEGGEESPQFKSYVESQNAIAAQRKAGLFTEVGSSAPAAGAEGKIEAKAKEVMTASEGKLTYEQAYAQVIADNPELYREYRGEAQSGVAVA